jgi:hypothetical protein
MTFNYCHDECEHNKGARHYWEETKEDGKKVRRGKSDASNKPLNCDLGYSQTVNSHKGLTHSLSQGSRICARLKKIFAKEVI